MQSSWTKSRIRALQNSLELSNTEFAHRCGVSLRTIENWRAGVNEARNHGVRRRLDRLETEASKAEAERQDEHLAKLCDGADEG